MKTNNVGRLKSIKLLTMLAFLIIGSVLFGQKNKVSKLSDFEITVEKSDKAIMLQCLKGCAWNELEFSTPKDFMSPEIDEFGMVEVGEKPIIEESGLASFQFKIEENSDELKFTGIEGTAWTELSFSVAPNNKQGINQFGMISTP